MRTIFVFLFLLLSFSIYSQCNISNRISPDGAMYYYMQPSVFYFTKKQELRGGIVTDKENYFIALQPVPFPKKPQGRKLKEDLEIKLSNNSVYRLKHFDTQYMEEDTVMQLLYIIDKSDLDDFMKFEVIQTKIDMKAEEGIRTYTFKLHKKAIMEQLACFMTEEKKEKNK